MQVEKLRSAAGKYKVFKHCGGVPTTSYLNSKRG